MIEEQAVVSASRDTLSPVVLLERTLRVFPGREAVVYGDRRLSWRQFADETGDLAGALKRAGLAEGDRVAVLLPNTPVHLAAHFALPMLGMPIVSINNRLAPAEIRYVLEHSGARLLLVDPELAPPLDGVIDDLPELEHVIEVADKGWPVREGRRSYDDFLDGAPRLEIGSTLEDEDALLAINYTSGTTGRPKGVMYTHRGAYLNAMGQIGGLSLTKDATFLWTLPMFHCNGWCMPWAVTGAAGRHICLRGVDPGQIVGLLDSESVTHFNGAPTVLRMIAAHPDAQGRRFDPPIRVATGGAPPSPSLLEGMENLGISITHLYGLTETYGPHTFCQLQDGVEELSATERARVMSRQGVPFLHALYLRVVDEQMNDVPADAATLGEVVMRGNNVMKGYFRDPEATAEAFRGGWFHSGDIGVMHEDGYVELRDRAKDIIISGGENISTIEVENTIDQHPEVAEVAVVGVPHEKWGEVPKAFVTKVEGSALTEAELVEFCRERLSHFKCPKGVVFGPLPKTATGKIQKFRLREGEWEGRAKRIG